MFDWLANYFDVSTLHLDVCANPGAPKRNFVFTVPTVSDEVRSTLLPIRTTPVMITTTVAVHKPPVNVTTIPKQGRDTAADHPEPVKPTAVSLPPSSKRFCESTERRGISWPQTHRGSTVERPCPKGTRGMNAFGRR